MDNFLKKILFVGLHGIKFINVKWIVLDSQCEINCPKDGIDPILPYYKFFFECHFLLLL